MNNNKKIKILAKLKLLDLTANDITNLLLIWLLDDSKKNPNNLKQFMNNLSQSGAVAWDFISENKESFLKKDNKTFAIGILVQRISLHNKLLSANEIKKIINNPTSEDMDKIIKKDDLFKSLDTEIQPIFDMAYNYDNGNYDFENEEEYEEAGEFRQDLLYLLQCLASSGIKTNTIDMLTNVEIDDRLYALLSDFVSEIIREKNLKFEDLKKLKDCFDCFSNSMPICKEISAIESCFNVAKGQNDPNFESYKQTLTHGIGEKIFFITGSIFDSFVND